MRNGDLLMAATDSDGRVHGLGDRPNMVFRVKRVDDRRVRLIPDASGSASTDGGSLLSGAGLPALTAFDMTEEDDGGIILERLDGHGQDVRMVTDDAFWEKVTADWDAPSEPMRV